MIKCQDDNWFTEEYGFFGDFYYISDNSKEGPYKGQLVSREQRTKDEVTMICDMMGVQPGRRLFDCPCGWGRHSIELAKRGVDVTAIDLNHSYLMKLQEALLHENEEVQKKITIDRCDMRYLIGAESYDYGINMFSSFGFFNDDEDLRVARNFYEMLKPGGKMMIHLDFNAERLEMGFGSDYAAERNISHEGKNYVLKVYKEYHEDDRRLHGLWKLVAEDGASVEKIYSFRIYSRQEMEELLHNVGFQVVSFYSTNQMEQTFDDIDTVIVAEK